MDNQSVDSNNYYFQQLMHGRISPFFKSWLVYYLFALKDRQMCLAVMMGRGAPWTMMFDSESLRHWLPPDLTHEDRDMLPGRQWRCFMEFWFRETAGNPHVFISHACVEGLGVFIKGDPGIRMKALVANCRGFLQPLTAREYEMLLLMGWTSFYDRGGRVFALFGLLSCINHSTVQDLSFTDYFSNGAQVQYKVTFGFTFVFNLSLSCALKEGLARTISNRKVIRIHQNVTSPSLEPTP